MSELPEVSKCAIDNRANQLNPKHPAYYQSLGICHDEARQIVRTREDAQHTAQPSPPPENNVTCRKSKLPIGIKPASNRQQRRHRPAD